MPRGDGTGPGGLGPMSGRGAGYCAGYAMPGYANPTVFRGAGPRMGWGGGGGGRGHRHWYYATGMPRWARFGTPGVPAWQDAYRPPTAQQEAQALRDQSEWLKEQLGAIEQRLSELEQEAE